MRYATKPRPFNAEICKATILPRSYIVNRRRHSVRERSKSRALLPKGRYLTRAWHGVIRIALEPRTAQIHPNAMATREVLLTSILRLKPKCTSVVLARRGRTMQTYPMARGMRARPVPS